MLSTESPRSAITSTTFDGGTPRISSTFAASQIRLSFGGFRHADSVIDQLQHVFVAGNDIYGIRFRCRFPRQRSDHVVGFVTFELQNRNAIPFQRPPDVWNLLHQIAGHLGSIRLIAIILRFFEGLRLDVELADRGNRFRLLIADGRRAHIKHRRQILGRKIISQLPQHVDENKSRSRRHTGLRRHRPLPRHGMIGAKNERHSIDQENAALASPAQRQKRAAALVRRWLGGDFFLGGNEPSLAAEEFFMSGRQKVNRNGDSRMIESIFSALIDI